jgi:hypothetical protein
VGTLLQAVQWHQLCGDAVAAIASLEHGGKLEWLRLHLRHGKCWLRRRSNPHVHS